MGYDWHADSFSEYSYHVPSRHIYLQPDSDEFQFEHLIKGLVVFTSDNLDPITIIMDAPGGDEYHGLACFDAVALCQAPVTIEAYGHCMSMGSLIMQAVPRDGAPEQAHGGYVSRSDPREAPAFHSQKATEDVNF